MSETLIQIGRQRSAAPSPDRREGRPEWLRIRLATPAAYHRVRGLVDRLNLHTVCQEARCPNIYECWGEHGTATFMILGDVCTRRCGFCAVITSVDRDDLPDGGARHFAQVIAAIHRRNAGTAVEVLTPDFRGVPEALDIVLAARPEVFSHNMETVPRLYRLARPGSRYDRSLGLLAEAARQRDAGDAGAYQGRIKTGIMLGLGETTGEIEATLTDIRGAGVEILTLGQYLHPTPQHLPVDRWVHPDEFAAHRAFALSLGFAHCEAGRLVRSSYHAHEHVKPTMAEAKNSDS